jgi:hypothetical protein
MYKDEAHTVKERALLYANVGDYGYYSNLSDSYASNEKLNGKG